MPASVHPFNIDSHLEGRRFKARSRRALLDLARDLGRSLRDVAREHGIDAKYLHELAATIPGLIEARRAWRAGFRASRPAA